MPNHTARRAEVVNGEVARVLREIGTYLEMEGVAFKPRAYEKAAETIGSFSEEVADIYARGLSRTGTKGVRRKNLGRKHG